MKVEVSIDIDRPVETVWHFYAVDQVKNHPRWDPQMKLEQVTEGPVGIGTVIKRFRTHFDPPVEGVMEVTEFRENESMAVEIQDGPNTTHGYASLADVGDGGTTLTMSADMPWIEESAEAREMIAGLMNRSASSIKELIEAET